MSKQIDPDSYRGKLRLIIIDKIIIGALIAVAFAVFDGYKTRELRRYDDSRREVDLGFRRAEYVKELVPIAMDRSKDVFVRAQALSALVTTESISAESAVSLTRKLLRSNVLGVDSYTIDGVTFLRETEADMLLSTMIKIMPDGVPVVLGEYTHVSVELDEARKISDERQVDMLNETSMFWRHVFQNTVTKLNDTELSFWNSEPFLIENLWKIDAIVPDIPELTSEEAEQFFVRETISLKTVGALRLVDPESSGSQSETQSAMTFLKPILNLSPTASRVFAVEVIKLLRRHEVVSSELSAEALEFVLTRQDVELEEGINRRDEGDAETYFDHVADYLAWSGKFSKVVAELEERVIIELGEFYNMIKDVDEESLQPERSYPVAWTFVQFLTNAKSADVVLGSDAVQLLSDLFAIERAKLEKTRLVHYAASWSR